MDKILTDRKQPAKTGFKKPGLSRSAAQKSSDHDWRRDETGSRGQILRLQSTVGNRALQRLLARSIRRATGPAPLVQRWGGQEHADIANATGIQIDLGNGVILDWGEVTSIAGDEVGTLEELQEWVKTETGKAKIRAALENAEVAGNGVKTLPAPFPEEKKEQKTRYYTLLLDNITHFQSGGMALDAYRGYHFQALDAALRTGIYSPNDSKAGMNEAYLAEAFGQHFLTDMFSGGHAITPRSEINDYYVNVWAPKAIDYLLANLKARLVAGIFQQVAAQSGFADVHPEFVKKRIASTLDDKIAEGMAQLKGGKAELTTLLGKGIGGLISGAIHDYYNAQGVKVSSVSHPEPWVAMGDSHLHDDADKINMEQAQLAVKAGLADVQAAFEIGKAEGIYKESAPQPDRLPSQTYFKFNSADLEGPAYEALEKAAAFLAYNPDYHLNLVGYADPIGTDEANDKLGQRRADSVADNIFSHMVASWQVSTSSRGEKDLVTTDPRKYNLNRRVEFQWINQYPGTFFLFDANQIAYQRASETMASILGPPYRNVEIYIPQVVEDLNPKVPDWHWENMPPRMTDMIDEWVKSRFDKELQEQLLSSDMLKKQKIDDIEIDPSEIVKGFLEEINDSPSTFLNTLFINPNDPNILHIDISNFQIRP